VVDFVHERDLLNLLKVIVEAIYLRVESAQSEVRKDVVADLHVKQMEQTEKDVTDVLVPFFKRQVADIVDRLKNLEEKSASDAANSLINQVFDPSEWHDELIDRLLPIMAVKMAEAGVSQLMTIGLDVRKKAKATGVQVGKSTTASQWLRDHPEDLDILNSLLASSGVANVGIMTEIPEWMIKQVAKGLVESFNQPYWESISQTTGGDAERVLQQGMKEGWSIRKMASEMKESLGGTQYARRRAERIARTESADALNRARKESVNKLKEELGEAGKTVAQVWLSVLGNTTRATHADLDGVPEDEDGMWNLVGIRIPWPGHFSLPPEERCNCYCTMVTEFGMSDEERNQLIDEYRARIGEELKPRKLSFEEKMKLWKDSLTEEEREAFTYYTEEGFYEIRRCQNLRRGCTQAIKEYIRHLYNAMDRAPKVKGMVYRGMTMRSDKFAEFMSKLERYKKLIDNGFLSTSRKREKAIGFMKQEGRLNRESVLLEIKAKRGVNISSVSYYEEEAEVLLYPGARLKLVDLSFNEELESYVMKMEEM